MIRSCLFVYFCLLPALATAQVSWMDLSLAESQAFPTVVAIENDPSELRGSGCTGIFISPELVLTAKHCQAAYSRIALNASRLNLLRKDSPFRIPDCDPHKHPSVSEWQGILLPVEQGAKADYQILKVQWISGVVKPPIRPAKLNVSKRTTGELVNLIGYPLEREGVLTISSGIIFNPN